MENPKVGTRVRWRRSGVNNNLVGVVTHEHTPEDPDAFGVDFPGWEGGHNGEFKDGRKSCYYFWNMDELEVLSVPPVPLPVVVQNEAIRDDLKHIQDAVNLFDRLNPQERREAIEFVRLRFF